MGRINILDKSVYNLIAAGEVVESPSAVIKELVENAIDAGGKNISVTICDGGLSLIEVADDGCGIENDDVERAFLRHATSKLFTADDLLSINTLGFRGEALSSIAAVSKTALKTCTQSNELGTEIDLSEGNVESIKHSGCKKGTIVTVKDLFFNVPARKKFLKKPSSETSACTWLVQRFALANPDISFTLVSNGITVFQSQGLGLQSAIFAVYGKECLSNCLPVNWFYKDIEVFGFIGKPEFTKANRNYQTLIVNGRNVKNITIDSAVQRAYQKFMTVRSFPFYVLNVKIPLNKIDVNVHPNKLDVRFSDAQDIFLAVYTAITNTLQPENNQQISEIIKQAEEEVKLIPAETPGLKQSVDVSELIRNSSEQVKMKIFPSTSDNFDISLLKKPDHLSDSFDEIQQKKIPAQDLWAAKAVGSLFNTYLLFEAADFLFFVDQHAAHEMLLYKKFTEEYTAAVLSRQDMLVPFVFSVNSEEAEFFGNNLEIFIEQGFDLQPFGKNTFKINSVPVILSQIDIKDFVDSVLSEFDCIAPQKKFIREYLAKKACRAAVKAGDVLNESEIVKLKNELALSDNLRCPHGRPIVVKLSKSEIERWFSRIQ